MHPPVTILAFDIGTRHTGVAVSFAGSGFAVTKDTIDHDSDADLVQAILALMDRDDTTQCVLGLPRLPGGEEGQQAAFVRSIGDKLAKMGIEVFYIDERYTTARNRQYDGNAAAACSILNIYLERINNLT